MILFFACFLFYINFGALFGFILAHYRLFEKYYDIFGYQNDSNGLEEFLFIVFAWPFIIWEFIKK